MLDRAHTGLPCNRCRRVWALDVCRGRRTAPSASNQLRTRKLLHRSLRAPMAPVWSRRSPPPAPVSGACPYSKIRTAADPASDPTLVSANGVAPRPGADFLVYVSWRGERQGIWTLTHGIPARSGAAPPRIAGSPTVAPDGRHIAFSVEDSGKTLLYMMDTMARMSESWLTPSHCEEIQPGRPTGNRSCLRSFATASRI